MPPRKRAKRDHSSSPRERPKLGTGTYKTRASPSDAKFDGEIDLLDDPWTDEQETALLKAIIKFKPVGLYKDIRMLAIVDYLTSQGFGPETAEHMRIPGIWQKLRSLYNLEALDDRENAVLMDRNEDDDTDTEKYWLYEPPPELADMMFERRLATEASSSPVTSRHAESRRGSTVADTDEPRSSPAPSRGRKSTRGTRSAARETRSTKLNVELGSEGQEKASDEDGESEEDIGENDEGEEEGDEGTDGGKVSEGEEEAEEEKGGPRSTRAQTSKSKQKDKKAPTGTATRRTGRRR